MTAAIHRLSRRRFAAAFALPLLAPAIPTHAARQEVAEDASALLVRAAAAMAGLASFHFALSTPRGATTILDAFELVRLEGDVLRPDRYRATIDATAAGFDVSVEAIGVGDRLWVTDPMAGGAFREFPLDAAAGDGRPWSSSSTRTASGWPRSRPSPTRSWSARTRSTASR
jgi:hypothetical protein